MFIFIIGGLMVELEVLLINTEVVGVTFGDTNLIIELDILVNFVVEVKFNFKGEMLELVMLINGIIEVILGVTNLVVTLDVLITFVVITEILVIIFGIVIL